jgi:hypothetical protein
MMTNNFSFIIHSWMMTSLKLKGNELIAYAIIYKYSDIKGQKFVVSIRKLAEIMNVSKNTAQAVLDSLIKKGFIHSVDTDFIVTAYRVDLDLIESFSVSETGTVPKTGTPKKSQEKQGSTGISNQESVPKTGTLENKKINNINNINKLANKNIRKQGGLLRGGSMSTSKYSTMLGQLLAFCRTNFYTRTEQQDYIFKALKQYLDYRIKFKLEPEQWQAILDSIKNFDAEDIARRVQTALAGGYKILVPSWEVNKPQRRVDNITPQKDDDNDHHDVEGVYF